MKCGKCEQTGFDSPGHMLIRSAMMLRRNVGRRIRLADTALTSEHWAILNMIIHHEGINQTALADFTGKNKPNLTRLLDKLEEEGFARRDADPEDRRSYLLHATAAGKRAAAEMRPRIETYLDEVFSDCAAKDIAAFRRVLLNILEKMEAMDEADGES